MSGGIVRIEQVRVTRNRKDFPIGSVWFNPTVPERPVTVQGSGLSTTADLPYTTNWTDVPLVERAVIEAPGVDGVMVAFFGGFVYVKQAGSPYPELRLSTGFPTYTRMGVSNTIGYFPFFLVDSHRIEADGTAEIRLMYRYIGSGTLSSAAQVSYSRPHVIFLPGAVRGSGAATPARRYWDGDSWRPEAYEGARVTFPDAPAPAKVNSSTSISRSPTSGIKNDTQFTFTATVSASSGGTPTGSVTFQVMNEGDTSWRNVATVALSSGKAVYKRGWTSAGTHSVRAVYGGSSAHNGSTSSATTVVVSGTLVTKTKTVSAGWVQAYNGSGGKISGSGADGAVHQGYYSGTHGNRKSLIRFNVSLPSDAEVTKVELICGNWSHWYYNAGGDLRVGWHDKTSAPSSFGVGAGATAKSTHGVGKGSWTVNITSWAKSVVTKSSFAGITIGPGASNAFTYYGYSAAGTGLWDLKITYKTAT